MGAVWYGGAWLIGLWAAWQGAPGSWKPIGVAIVVWLWLGRLWLARAPDYRWAYLLRPLGGAEAWRRWRLLMAGALAMLTGMIWKMAASVQALGFAMGCALASLALAWSAKA